MNELKYVDPKADLTFKKVFGEHSDLLASLLNALLPLPEDGKIVSIEYLPPEIVPDDPLHKDSIVDVRCKDQNGRQFIVEMQMIWSPDYNQRALFNAAKAYSRELPAGGNYRNLKTVYSLNLLNDNLDLDVPQWYHHYRLEHREVKVVVQEVQRIDSLEISVVSARRKFARVRLGCVEECALIVIGRPNHLHLHNELATILILAANIYNAVFVQRVVGNDLRRKIFD